ncbi:MAG: DNA polymerase III subunit gamma/tau [Candidatus Saganbacteria bacterium]|nr:DNA polymerase III subunit gamma/tau [Candidatus Saganbacteria bacterium]
MNHISLYRKYRSQTFEEIIGQEPIITTLKNAISGKRIGHAYLFTGPRGTGKTSTARIFAKALNCGDAATVKPCGKCDQCRKITSGYALNVIEIDAASNRGIDEIRDLREKIRFKPVEGRYKIYIIDEVHMLTPEAFNALLKTLEEPPPDTVFILATTEPQRVPVTISSRCQRFDFGRISLDEIIKHLKKIAKDEGQKISDDAVRLIARSSEGAMRDAISLIDQLSSFCEGEIKVEDVVEVLGTAEPEFLFGMGEAVLNGNEKDILISVQKAVDQGVSVEQLAKDLVYHFRNLLMVKVGSESVLELSEEQINRLKKSCENHPLSKIKMIIKAISGAETDMKWHRNSRLVLEIALLEAMEGAGRDQIKEAVKIAPEKNVPEGEAAVMSKDEALSSIRGKWKEILEKVKARNVFGYVSLCEAEVSSLDGKGRVVLKFKKGYSFHKARIEEQANKTNVEEAIGEITGKKISVICVMGEEDKKTSERPVAPVSADDIIEMFDGKTV